MTRPPSTTMLPLEFFLLYLVASCLQIASPCSYPKAMQMAPEDEPWRGRIYTNGSHGTEYYIRKDSMEIYYIKTGQRKVRWRCMHPYQDKLLLKRTTHLVQTYYRCAKFVLRSRSVVQIYWSHESETLDMNICEDKFLKLDPWPVVWYKTVMKDFTSCPLSGGFDMKIEDSMTGPNGCNQMHRPMRMEMDCLAGEGVRFDFMASHCVPDIEMKVQQQALCVAEWQDSRYYFTVLRRQKYDTLWCLVVPKTQGNGTTAYLYSDLSCRYDKYQNLVPETLRRLTLKLHRRVYPELCDDEYKECDSLTCNAYYRHQCHKSCGLCNSDTLPKRQTYPKKFRGTWFLKDVNGYHHVTLSDTNLDIDRIGNFKAVSYPGGPKKRTKTFTTVSVYENGCRPRYTCVKMKRLAPSVISYSLAESFRWPELEQDFASNICDDDRFGPDSSPIDDMYRSYENSGKPIIRQYPRPEAVNCNITSVLTLSATLPERVNCSGSLYQHCGDPTKVRLDFSSCGGLIAAHSDYRCVASYKGLEWETVLLVQNVHDDLDARCFVFSNIYPHDAYVLVAGQCDQKSFTYAMGNLREPLLTLIYRREKETCKVVPVTTTTLAPTPSYPLEHGGAHMDARANGSHHSSLVVNVPGSGNSGKQGGYSKGKSTPKSTDSLLNEVKTGDGGRGHVIQYSISLIVLSICLVTFRHILLNTTR